MHRLDNLRGRLPSAVVEDAEMQNGFEEEDQFEVEKEESEVSDLEEKGFHSGRCPSQSDMAMESPMWWNMRCSRGTYEKRSYLLDWFGAAVLQRTGSNKAKKKHKEDQLKRGFHRSAGSEEESTPRVWGSE